MLDANDPETLYSLRQLRNSARATGKPMMYWIGAGTSAWCGYPLWQELAHQFHSSFLRSEPQYDKRAAVGLLEGEDYPGLFQLCSDTNRQRYLSQLARSFELRDATPVYSRFIAAINNVQPLFAVTTNIDECLEHNLNRVTTVQRSDLERCLELLQRGISFVCKLHGTASSVESAIFTSSDYGLCVKDSRFLCLLQHLFAECTVVFVGYSLSDRYVITLLSDNCDLRRLFGDGPHYVIAADVRPRLPESVKVIKDCPEPHTDHRGALQVLEVINYARQVPVGGTAHPSDAGDDSCVTSSHFISDIYPVGTWQTSQSVILEKPGWGPFLVMSGMGWTNEDKPSGESTAMHDLLVGLLCFDITYVPFSCVPRVHMLLGDESFWELVKSGAIRFIHCELDEALLYPKPEGIAGGGICSFKVQTKAATDLSIREMIRLNLAPVPGKEQEAEGLFTLLESKTDVIAASKESLVLETIKGLLLLPHVRQELGMSDGTPIESIPRWLSLSVLRFANIVKMGVICQTLRIASTKLIFGATKLAEHAYSAVAAEGLVADQAAQYVLSGRFNTDLGRYVTADSSIIVAVLRFRETPSAVTLRREVLAQLAIHAGSEVVVSINNGLQACIPPTILEKARNEMSGLLLAHSCIKHITPALWNDYKDNATARWRDKSARELSLYSQRAQIQPYDLCPCGSGDKFRFCCKQALNI